MARSNHPHSKPSPLGWAKESRAVGPLMGRLKEPLQLLPMFDAFLRQVPPSVGESETGIKDTPRHVEKRFQDMMLARSPGERLAMACGMFATARSLVLAGIRAGHGELNRAETRRQLFLRFYEKDFEPEKREKILEHLSRADEALL